MATLDQLCVAFCTKNNLTYTLIANTTGDPGDQILTFRQEPTFRCSYIVKTTDALSDTKTLFFDPTLVALGVQLAKDADAALTLEAKCAKFQQDHPSVKVEVRVVTEGKLVIVTRIQKPKVKLVTDAGSTIQSDFLDQALKDLMLGN